MLIWWLICWLSSLLKIPPTISQPSLTINPHEGFSILFILCIVCFPFLMWYFFSFAQIFYNRSNQNIYTQYSIMIIFFSIFTLQFFKKWNWLFMITFKTRPQICFYSVYNLFKLCCYLKLYFYKLDVTYNTYHV